MQDQKLADATPKTTSAPALWKNPASSIKAAAHKRRSLIRLWTTACSRRSELRFHRSHIRRLDSTHRSLQYLTPYCEVTCHSGSLSGTAAPLCTANYSIEASLLQQPLLFVQQLATPRPDYRGSNYALTWNIVIPSRILITDTDYQLDYHSPRITFGLPLDYLTQTDYLWYWSEST